MRRSLVDVCKEADRNAAHWMRGLVVAALVLSGFATFGGTKMVTLTVANDAVTETQADLPVLVRLSTAISGFSYSDFNLPNGGDLQFTDADGNVLPHEVDTWDEEGESLVWVKLPTCANGTTFTCFYGSGNPSSASATDVWSDYYAVYHMNGASEGNESDSTSREITLVASGNDVTKMTSIDAKVGKGRVVDSATGTSDASANRFNATGIPAGLVGNAQLTVSLWLWNGPKCKNSYYPPVFSYKNSSGTPFAQCTFRNTDTSFNLQGQSKNTGEVGFKLTKDKIWHHLTFIFDATTITVCANGISNFTGTITAAADAGANAALSVMNEANGKVDELRFYPGALSNARVAADYATQTRTDFLSAGTVTDVVMPVLDVPVFGVTAEGKMSASVNVTEGSGTLVFEYANGASVTRVPMGSVTAPVAVTDVPTLTAGAIYTVTAEITSPAGIVVRQTSEGSFLNGEVSIAKTTDAAHPDEGAFTVTRPDTAEAKAVALTLGYVVETTLSGDVDYISLTGSVTIPAGASAATITVTPLDNHTAPRSGELKVALAGGSFLPSVSTSAVMTVSTARLPMPLNNGTVTLDGVQYADAVTYRPTGTGYTVVLTNNAVLNTNVKNGSGFGMTASDSATIVVTDHSVVSNTASVTVFNTTTRDSTYRVENGANLVWGRNQGALGLYGVSNTLIVTNAFLEMPTLSSLGITDTDRAHIRIYGDGNRYYETGAETIVNYAGLSLNGTDGLAEIRGGRNVNGDFNTNQLGLNGTNNCYRQTGGTYRDWLRLSFDVASASNVVEVCEGATNDIDRMDTDYIQGTANRIVIDNARLEMGRDNVLSLFGTSGAAANFVVELKGSKPELAFTGQSAIGNVDAERIHFVFTPPADGWTVAPVTCGKNCITNHYDIAVSIAAFPEGVKRIPLFTFGKATELDAASIPVTSAPLKNCLLVYEGKTLYLRPPKHGLAIIVR